MKKRAINIFAILVCVVTLSVIGKADVTNRLKIEIPFDFIIKEQTFSAGKYTIERLNPLNPAFMILRGDDEKSKMIFQVESVTAEKPAEKSYLIFKQRDSDHFLVGILTPDSQYRIVSSDVE